MTILTMRVDAQETHIVRAYLSVSSYLSMGVHNA